MSPAVFRPSLRCNNRCMVCPQAGAQAAPNGAEDYRAALIRLRQTSDDLVIAGGEPTLWEDLEAALAFARELGFVRIGIQTNGRRLVEEGLPRRLTEAGLTFAHLTVFGAEASVHDYHTGVPGSLKQLLAGAAQLRTLGAALLASTVITRSNFRGLATLPWLLSARGVKAWNLVVPRVAGRAHQEFDRIVPRLGMALPFALHALQAAQKLGLSAFIEGAPLCALGPFAGRRLSLEPRSYGAACAACAARGSCPGVDGYYLARHGEEELSPVPVPAPAALAPSADAALFVGAGLLALPSEGPAHQPPSAARQSLEALGKVRPATQEVRSASGRKSGEALKELFPSLFTEEPGPAAPPEEPG